MNEAQQIAALTRRVESLEARAAITELATAYAVACDTHDMPGLMHLFTEDAEFASPSGLMVAKGVAEIEAMFIELFKVRGPAYHWTHDVCITVADDNESAQGVVYSHAETTPNDVVSLAAMRYADNYLQTDDGWKFARREISFLYYVPAAEYTQGLNHSKRLTFGDQRIAADYPEQLAPWQAFAEKFLS